MTEARRAARAAVSAVAAGVLHAAALAWPGTGQPLWWLQLLSLGWLAWLLLPQVCPRRAFVLGWLYALAWLAGTFWWLFISMHVYGGLAAPLAVVAVLALAGLLGLYYGAACAVFAWVAPARPAWAPVTFAALWLAAELARGRWFTGFPWGAGGYAHGQGPLAALLPVVGVYGVGFVAALLAAGLAGWVLRAHAARAQRLRMSPARSELGVWAALLGLAGACHLAAPLWSAPAGPRLSVALLQGNIAQDEKFGQGSGIPLALQWYASGLREATASLVVAPETAVPLLPAQLPQDYLPDLRRSVEAPPRAALIGIPLGDYDEGYSNSVVGLQPGAPDYRYDKHHLVPFGEFIPPWFKWFTRMMNIPLGDFRRGALAQPSFEWQGQRLAPNICYEDLFGEELAARFRDPRTAPTAFVNLSNIAWFGDTVAIDQHLQISRVRAIEFARPMIRATNTGATVIIDRSGRVTHALPRHTRGVLVGAFEGGDGRTPYAAWASRAGLWPLWTISFAIVLIAVQARRSRPGGPGQA